MMNNTAHIKKGIVLRSFAAFVFCFLPVAFCLAVDAPPRIFFSDAKLSFTVPDNWSYSESFPYGPLMSRTTPEGSSAFIVCQLSDPLDATKISADVSSDTLKTFAAQDVAAHLGAGRVLASAERALGTRSAYEITWEQPEGATQSQSVYFYVDGRFAVLTLRAERNSFPWLVPEFQTWLSTIRILARHDSGMLETPSHGGLWVHQTAGAKILVPENWLIGVADDRQVGAVLANGKMHADFTATVELAAPNAPDITAAHKKEARRVIEQKGFTVTAETEEPFHGFPAVEFSFEGTESGRFVKGQDIWVFSPKARWLLTVEGDGAFLRQISSDVQSLLGGIHFL